MGDALQARVAAEAVAPASRAAASLELNGLDDFDAVVTAHQRRIYRLLLGMLRDPDAAETLSQECFLRAYQRRATYRGEASVATWLVGIAVNLARDHARSRRAGFWRKLFANGRDTEAVGETLADRRATPEEELLAQEGTRAVWKAAGRLPAKQRAVFLLRFVEEMTLEEIATAMGVRTGTVKSHLSRAVGSMRQALKEYST
jgi:RNA polymerase sigma-70 factor, ECF subfamily